MKDLATGQIDAQILGRIDLILSLDPRPEILTIDIPIGLTDRGPRQCDLEARARLGAPRASSVFPPPIRAMLNATTHEEACRIGQSIEGRKLSIQAWGIFPKIREVDSFLRSDGTLGGWIREIHPEVCFWCWSGRKAMVYPKKPKRKRDPDPGRAEREDLVIPTFGQAYHAAQARLTRGQYQNDDLLDAFAALWTAERAYQGNAMVIPSAPPKDSCGLRMEMVV